MGTRDSRDLLSKQFDYSNCSRILYNLKEYQFIGRFGRNCPIGLEFAINGSDETHRIRIVTVKLHPLDRQSTAKMEPRHVRYKNACNIRQWITMRFSSVLISAVITPLDQRLRLKWFPMNQITSCTFRFKWVSTVLIPCAIRRSIGCHIASPSW